jgi:peptidoglycan/LPS O-acetylase OafA/YrhL
MRNASLEGVRGAAALLVVLFHAGVSIPSAVRNADLAVDLFFVLSGFVICSAYGRASLSSIEQFKAFVIRRIGRIWPVHLATTVLFYVALNAAWLITSRTFAGVPPLAHVAALVTMTQGLNLFTDLVGTKVNWSVGDEFYVYLIFAALCFLLRGKARLAAFAALAILGYAVAVAMSLVHNHCLQRGECMNLTFSFGWSRCIAGFFVGALIAEFRHASVTRAMTRRIPQCLAFAAVLLLMSYAHVTGLAFAAPLIFGLFVASLAGDSGPIAKFFHERPFQYLGRISYSLYLGHAVAGPLYAVAITATANPLINFLAVAAFLAASVALAHLLNRFIETPWRARFNAWAETASRPRTDPSSSARAT